MLEEERFPGSAEITFGPLVAEERILPDSLLGRVTTRPRAIAAYKEMKCSKYGKEFDFSGGSLVAPHLRPSSVAGAAAGSESGLESTPSGPFTGPKGDDEAQRDLVYNDNELFDASILEQPVDPPANKPQD